jgi:transcriptional regulator of acetoin/glycerol metabolism
VYPGNVRELRAQLRNLLTSWDGRAPLCPSDLIAYLSALGPHLGAEDLAERQRMVEAYRVCRGNQEAARRQLGLSRGEWRHRWSRLGLDAFRRR